MRAAAIVRSPSKISKSGEAKAEPETLLAAPVAEKRTWEKQISIKMVYLSMIISRSMEV